MYLHLAGVYTAFLFAHGNGGSSLRIMFSAAFLGGLSYRRHVRRPVKRKQGRATSFFISGYFSRKRLSAPRNSSGGRADSLLLRTVI
jgi:hypothetical protein